tara:strand:- start:7294 stop:9726 length:2433 start_codon:yes stop_codon:yes gene_type:complete
MIGTCPRDLPDLMSSPTAKTNLLWALVPLAVVVLIIRFNATATTRIETVSTRFVERLVDPTTVTGAEVEIGVRRSQVVPGHNLESMEWILQAEQIRQDGVWRLEKVDYDNAPNGRGVESPSAIRWWLAWLSGDGKDAAEVRDHVAAASLRSDPILHLVLFCLLVGIWMWHWGFFPAAAGSLILGLYYPLIGSFHPGAPTSAGMATVLCGIMWISFAAGLKTELHLGRGRSWWIISGIAAGFAIWIAPNRGFLLGIALTVSGMLAEWRQRQEQPEQRFPWWSWGVAGAMTALILYGIDFAGREAAWANGRLHQIHPLYTISWLGIAAISATLGNWRKQRSDWIKLGLGIVATFSLVAYMIGTKDDGFLSSGLGADLLTHLPQSVSSKSFVEWVNDHSAGTVAAGTMLPLGLIAWAAWIAFQTSIPRPTRILLGTSLLPLVIAVAVGFSNLSWWGSVGVGLALVVVILAGQATGTKGRVGLLGFIIFTTGIAWLELGARMGEASDPELIESDVRSLAERDLGHWLSLRGDEFHSVVLSPPDTTPALYFYGGVKGLGSPFPENGDGFIAAVRIASASSPDESLALATQRELSHIVIPSWDGFLDEYAQLGAAQPEHSMMAMLHQWLAPRWIRAMDHTLPADEVFDGFDTKIFAVTETQDNASALSRLGEYFAETKRHDFAAAIAVTLQKSFPSDLSGLVAQAHIGIAQGNFAVFNESFESIRQQVEDERDGDLEFDRRVSLANILMLGREPEFARDQVIHCMDEMDAYLLKTVSTANLYRFILLTDSFQEPFPEPELDEFARALLQSDLENGI